MYIFLKWDAISQGEKLIGYPKKFMVEGPEVISNHPEVSSSSHLMVKMSSHPEVNSSSPNNYPFLMTRVPGELYGLKPATKISFTISNRINLFVLCFSCHCWNIPDRPSPFNLLWYHTKKSILCLSLPPPVIGSPRVQLLWLPVTKSTC